jgi:ribosomal protein S18 acetylase RimI-like enzyme
MPIEYIPFNHKSSLIYDAVRVYCEVWGRNQEDSIMFFRKYASYGHFIGYVASDRSRVIGMGFGTISEDGQWWHDKVVENVGKKHTALQDAWVLTELAVLKAYRNQEIGTALHDRVLQAQPFLNVLLSTQADNFGAKRFYERHGWNYLHKGFAFQQGRQEYCIMHKEIAHEH